MAERILANGQDGRLLIAGGSVEIAAQGRRRRPAVRMVAYTGAPMRLMGFSAPVLVDLQGMQIGDQVPVLLDHVPAIEAMVGRASARVVDGQLHAAGELTASTEPAQTLLALARDGLRIQASIGANILTRRFVRAGEAVAANGRTFTAPAQGLVVAEESTLRELSLVPMGADENTRVAIAAAMKHGGNMDPLSFFRGNGHGGQRQSDPHPQQTPQPDPLQGSSGNPGGGAGAVGFDDAHFQLGFDSARAERARIQQIEELVAGDWGDDLQPRIAELRAAAINNGTSPDALRRKLFEELRDHRRADALRASRSQAPMQAAGGGYVPMNQPDGPDMGETITAALALTAGVNEKVVADGISERSMNAATSGRMRNFSIHALLHTVLQAAGEPIGPGARVDASTIRAAFEANARLQASGGPTTLSLPGILANVQNKAMLEAYEAVATTWRLFANTTDVKDFKPWRRFRLVGTGQFAEVGQDGELKRIGLKEQDYDGQLATHGGLIQLTRQMQINDDMGAFMQIALELGRMSAIKLEKSVYTLVISNPGNFFGSNNKNLVDVGLDIDGLTSAEELFLDQTDDNGDPLLIVPAVLLVPTALRTKAFQLVNSSELNETTTANVPAPRGNPHHQRFTPASSPWLNSQGLSGGSDDGWYLFANPNAGVSAVTVGFLNGRQMPTIETGEASFETLGMRWRAYHDFGVGLGDHRAAVRSDGGGD